MFVPRGETPELRRWRERFAISAALITPIAVLLLLLLSTVTSQISIAPRDVALVFGVSLLVSAVTYVRPEVGRHLVAPMGSVCCVLATPEPFLTSSVTPGVFIAPLLGVLCSTELVVAIAWVLGVAGLYFRGGEGSVYGQADVLAVLASAAALMIAAQRLLASGYERLTVEQRRSAALVSEIDDVIVVAKRRDDGRWRADYVSPSALRVLGMNEQAFRGSTLGELVHESDRSAFIAAARRAADGASETVQFRSGSATAVLKTLEARIKNLSSHPEVEGMVFTIRDVSEREETRERFEGQLSHQALHDPLTDLPNRTAMLEDVSSALSAFALDHKNFVLLLCDLDGFQTINDSLGHDLGDRLLCAVAVRVRSFAASLGGGAYRSGGDEFVVLLPSSISETTAMERALGMVQEVGEPYEIEGANIFVSASVGLVSVRDDHSSAEALFRDADVAMYRAKESGGARVELFEDRHRQRLARRHAVQTALRQAVAAHKLVLYYQAKYDLRTHRLQGYEALLRWTDEQLGFVSPAEFIPLAEDTGLIEPLGAWVIEEGVRWIAQQQAQHGDHELELAVNISARQLHSGEFLNVLRRVLETTGVKPQTVELEVTESVAMGNVPLHLERLEAARAMGVKLALDDFGTGYSSLSYLRRFPLDILKIDRSFVAGLGSDLGDEHIVRFLVDMARTMGLRTVAEGVETEAQLITLHALGCEVVQGFLLARPAPGADAAKVARSFEVSLDAQASMTGARILS